MKSFICGASLLVASSVGCMSDRACNVNSEISMCCYMNECVPSSTIGCKGTRMDFFRHLQTLDMECKMDEFAAELREKSERVRNCDAQGINCIDYVTEVMSDPGVFE